MGSGGSAKRKLAESPPQPKESPPPPQPTPMNAVQQVIPEPEKQVLDTSCTRKEDMVSPVPELPAAAPSALEQTMDLRGSVEALPEAPARLPFADVSSVRAEDRHCSSLVVAEGPDVLNEEMLASVRGVEMSPPIKSVKKLELTDSLRNTWKPELKPVHSSTQYNDTSEDLRPADFSKHTPQSCLSPDIQRVVKNREVGEDSLDEEVLRSIEGLPMSPPRHKPGKLDLTESAGHELDSLLNLMDSK